MYNEILGLVTFIATFVLMVLMYRFFGKQGLIAWVAIGTIIANIQVIKTVEIFGISATLGNVMFASIYLATDILNDIYGRRVAKRAVWLGFSSTLIMIIVMQLSIFATTTILFVVSLYASSHVDKVIILSFTVTLTSELITDLRFVSSKNC
ncbi:queuosine precursor transporter [Staphylococcus aureus]|nr:queuosine precursor transporter [Staphylococcus aureus]